MDFGAGLRVASITLIVSWHLEFLKDSLGTLFSNEGPLIL